MENLFITMINEGRIKNSDELKRAFHSIAKKTHPDMVGSDRYVDRFIKFNKQFSEAKEYLKGRGEMEDAPEPPLDYRLLFYQELFALISLEEPGRYLNEQLRSRVKTVGTGVRKAFLRWKESESRLFNSAALEYLNIRDEKSHNDFAHLRKPLIMVSLHPLIFSLCSYHISGKEFHLKQFYRNLKSVIVRLEEAGFLIMKEALLYLAADVKRGPAILDG